VGVSDGEILDAERGKERKEKKKKKKNGVGDDDTFG